MFSSETAIEPAKWHAIAPVVLALLIATGFIVGTRQVEMTVSTDGLAVYEKPPVVVRFGESAQVTDSFITAGDTIEEGAPLFSLGQSTSLVDGRDPLRTRKDFAERRLAEIIKQIEDLEQRRIAIVESNDIVKSTLLEDLELLEGELALMNQVKRKNLEAVGRIEGMTKDAFVSEQAFDEAELELLRSESALVSLERERLTLERELQLTDFQTEVQLLRWRSEQLGFVLARQRLQEEIFSIERQRERIVLAPVSGKVGDLSFSTGEDVESGQIALTIIPASNRLMIRAKLSPNLAPSVKTDQRVRISVSEGPYGGERTYYGTVSRVYASLLDERDTSSNASGPIAEIVVEGGEAALGEEGSPLRLGGAVTAHFIIKEAMLYSLLTG